jgi:hypothetical protein
MQPLLAPSLRHALLISGVGLSVLALANAELAGDTCSVADAHCDARYAPPEVDASAFTVPLDGELFLPVANSRATRVSCATYKANFPIEVSVTSSASRTALEVSVLTSCSRRCFLCW